MRFFRLHEGENKEHIRLSVASALDGNFKTVLVKPRYHNLPEYLEVGIVSLEHLKELQIKLDIFFKKINEADRIKSTIEVDFNNMDLFYIYNIW